jgi:hypothetical protein
MKLRLALVIGISAALAVMLMIGLAGRVARLDASRRLTPEGWGQVKIGMSRSDVEAALHATLTIDDSASGADVCFYGWAGIPERPKPPLLLRFVDRRLAVIGLSDGSLRTDRGVKLGDPESVVQAAYGPVLQKTPAPYYDDKDPRHQLYFWAASKRGLLFWIDATGHVERIEAGTQQLKAMEGCA